MELLTRSYSVTRRSVLQSFATLATAASPLLRFLTRDTARSPEQQPSRVEGAGYLTKFLDYSHVDPSQRDHVRDTLEQLRLTVGYASPRPLDFVVMTSSDPAAPGELSVDITPRRPGVIRYGGLHTVDSSAYAVGQHINDPLDPTLDTVITYLSQRSPQGPGPRTTVWLHTLPHNAEEFGGNTEEKI